MKCMHCGSVAGTCRDDELTVDECLSVADQLIDLGCKHVSLIGGEVFLFKGWEEIARKLTDDGVDVNIATNALMLGAKQIKEIKYARLNNVGISLDGMEENHNKIRNSKISFKKVVEAIDLLKRNEVNIAIITSLLDFNFYDLQPLYELLVYNEIPVWQIQIATAMGSLAEKKNILLKRDKVPQISNFIREKNLEQRIRVIAADNIGYFDENESYLRDSPGYFTIWKGCQAGLRVVGIDSIGNVKGCEALYSKEFVEGNLRNETLSEIWTKRGNFAYNREFDIGTLAGNCANCDKGLICRGGCRASCYFTSGDRFENRYCCYPNKAKIKLEAK